MWAPVLGQTIPDAQLVGTVRDATREVLVGATITASSPQLIGGARDLRTDSRGDWRLPALPPGVYEVRAAATGFRPAARQNLVLIAGTTLTVDIELQLSGITDAVEATGLAPTVDVKSAAVPADIGRDLLEHLPTSRTISDLINLAPGVSGDAAYGGTKRSNAISIDGIDTTEPSEQDPWLRYAQNWLEEMQIAGLGAEAEHGRFTGVAAYAIVRSGTNNFSGLGEYWTTRGGWVANNTRALSASLQHTFASQRVDAYWNASGQVGGPFLRDRLWFFAGIDHTTHDYAPAGYDGAEARMATDNRGVFKLTAAAWSHGRVEALVHTGKDSIANAGLGIGVALDAAGRQTVRQTSWSAGLISDFGQSVVSEIRYTGYSGFNSLDPQPPQSTSGPVPHLDQLTNSSWGNVSFLGRDDDSRHDFSAAVTWYTPLLALAHELKAGIEIGRARNRFAESYPGGQIYLDYGGQPDLVYLWNGSSSVGDASHAAAYIQDRVALFRRVTFQPGLRVDMFRGSTPANADVFATNPLSPRLGVAWDVRGDHRYVVRLHYGRYTDPAFAQAYLLTDQSGASPQIVAQVVGPGVFEEISRSAPGPARWIDPHIKQSCVDQFLVGAEQQLRANVSLQLQYIHRRFENFMSYMREGAQWAPTERRDPGPDGVEGTSDDGPLYTVYNLTNLQQTRLTYTNPADAWRRYDGVQVVLRTRQSGQWDMQASYTWSRSTGTVSNQYHVNSGVRSSGGMAAAENPNMLINSGGNVPIDPTNEVKVLGAWTPRWLGGFNVSGVYRYTTGAAWGRTFVARKLQQGSEAILAEPRGTRRLDAIDNLDLRVEKTVRLGGRRVLGMFVDVFNVTNQGVPDSDWGTAVITASGPSLGLPIYWREPRQVRAAVRMSF